MQLVSSRNIDQRCYYENWLVHPSLGKDIKDFKIEKPKPKAQKPKASNSFSCLIKVGILKPPTKLGKKKKNTEDGKSKRRTPILVLLVPQSLESI